MTDDPRALVFERRLDAPRAAVWRCWTEPALLVRWFTPAPWRTVRAELDLRPGGSILIGMQGPEGPEVPNRGVYLEIVPGRKLVTTDAFVSAWEPAKEPFMTLTVTLGDDGAGTAYRAVAAHWTAEARARHEAMGFHEGWGAAADQLQTLAKSL